MIRSVMLLPSFFCDARWRVLDLEGQAHEGSDEHQRDREPQRPAEGLSVVVSTRPITNGPTKPPEDAERVDYASPPASAAPASLHAGTANRID